ncbi:MAG: class I SAM-dependent methyltransferase [Gammaproteobacteria bacterium]|nr:class I SAM-dependent methyltransferase [Gammaproteobacteria bacterium]
MLTSIKKLISGAVTKVFPFFQRAGLGHAGYLRGSISEKDIGEPGPLIAERFAKLRDVPGWFNVDDTGHFSLVLAYQSAMGVTGDLLEIGSYHGRSTSLMATFLQPDEKIVVCDAFESGTEDNYPDKPSVETLLRNIRRLTPDLGDKQIVVHQCLSNDLRLASTDTFRFVHIDGGHSAEQVYFDLKLCASHTMTGGVIVVDDYHNRRWPGVTEGTDRFLDEVTDLGVLADLNRHGALGRKLYLVKL